MLYDRPYMRQAPGYEPQPAKTTMVTKLLVVTVGVFVLQQVLNVFFPGPRGGENPFLWDWFALSGVNFRELKVWTVFSYGFMHSTQALFHLVGNMLGLFFIGRLLEPTLGRRQFLLLYLGSMLIGGLIYLFFHMGGVQPVVGASAAVFGILTVFCLLHPEQPITLLLFFVLPLTVKPKWVLRVSLGLAVAGLLFYELPGKPPHIAHSAHLGGIIAGVLYHRFVYLRGGAVFTRPGASKASMELPEWFKRRKHQPTAQKINYTVNRSSSRRDELQKEVDRILDKINASGFGSLSDGEKQTLDHAKDILR